MIITDTRTINRTITGLRDRVPLILQQGGTSCFAPNTLVVTNEGNIHIEKIKKGDVVLTFNEDKKVNEERTVLDVFRFDNTKKTIKVKLKNGGTIIATEDHEFFYKGGWHTLKHLLSL